MIIIFRITLAIVKKTIKPKIKVTLHTNNYVYFSHSFAQVKYRYKYRSSEEQELASEIYTHMYIHIYIYMYLKTYIQEKMFKSWKLNSAILFLPISSCNSYTTWLNKHNHIHTMKSITGWNRKVSYSFAPLRLTQSNKRRGLYN